MKKVAHQSLINLRTRQKLVTPASYKDGMAKMMHSINPAKNESKFYEMVIVPKDDGTFVLIKSHGGLTDNPNKIQFWEEPFLSFEAALTEMQKKTREKLRKGYKDTFLDNRGQYPIGLTREVGFGWDTQEVTKTPVAIPALQSLLRNLDSAIEAGDRVDQEGMSIALADVSRILFDMPESSMTKDLQRKLSTPAKQLLSGNVNPKLLSRALKTVRNSIKNQLSEVNRMASARSALVKLAAGLPAGSSERRAILAGLAKKASIKNINIPGKHILDNAQVLGDAEVRNNAQVFGNAEVNGPNAKVYSNAKVHGNAKVLVHAQVSDKAEVYGDARIYERAMVFGQAKVFDDAKVFDRAEVSGAATVYGNAKVYGDAKVDGYAKVFGKADISGDAEIAGGKWDGSEGPVTSGRWFGPGVPAWKSDREW
jgi:carbonic anhydrase/acetyltransferase-like protein (isoleucine patch superfamily)/predicted DNA-binding WGR domain protein